LDKNLDMYYKLNKLNFDYQKSQMSKLSCIVIAKNQIKTIPQCLKSIFEGLHSEKIVDYEVLYIDSNSTDGTIDVVKNIFNDTVIIAKLTGTLNAAVARNAGRSLATGDVLLFVDGDMVLDATFLSRVYSSDAGLRFDVVSGKLEEVLYTSQWLPHAHIEDRYHVVAEKTSYDLGGIFLIKTSIFDRLNGFKSYLRENEDTDFCMRIYKAGYNFKRIPFRIATHHTIIAHSVHQALNKFFNLNMMCSGVFYREHLFNHMCWKMILTHQRYLCLLIISIGLSIGVHPLFFVLYPIAVSVKYFKNREVSYWEMLLSTFLLNISVLSGFIGYYPKCFFNKEITVEKR